MTALKDDTADHILSLFISLIKFHCTMGYQRWCFVDPQHLSYSFHLSQMLYIYHLYFFFLVSSATICLLQKNNKGDKNITVPTSFWNIFDWPSPCNLLPSPSPVQSLQGIFSTALTVTTCYQKIRVVLPSSPLCIFPSLTLSCLYHYLGLLLTEHNPPNPVKSILTGYFSAISEG